MLFRLSPLPFRRAACVALLWALSLPAPGWQERAPSSNDDVAMHRFVGDLLARMTLDEKIGQMSQISYKEPHTVSHEENIRKGRVGSFLFLTDPAEIDRLQHVAVEETRLHIPLLFRFDVVHGFRTIYPIPLALA